MRPHDRGEPRAKWRSDSHGPELPAHGQSKRYCFDRKVIHVGNRSPFRLEVGAARAYTMHMKEQAVFNAPPVLKVVGRRAAASSPLRRLEELNAFLYKHTHERTRSGELFPVRKIVGRPRPQRG